MTDITPPNSAADSKPSDAALAQLTVCLDLATSWEQHTGAFAKGLAAGVKLDPGFLYRVQRAKSWLSANALRNLVDYANDKIIRELLGESRSRGTVTGLLMCAPIWVQREIYHEGLPWPEGLDDHRRIRFADLTMEKMRLAMNAAQDQLLDLEEVRPRLIEHQRKKAQLTEVPGTAELREVIEKLGLTFSDHGGAQLVSIKSPKGPVALRDFLAALPALRTFLAGQGFGVK